MRGSLIYTFPLLVLTNFGAQASPGDSALLIAKPESTQTMSFSGKFSYQKTFRITLSNVGKSPVDLGKTCFVLTGGDGRHYGVDTIEDTISKGIVEPGKSANGFVVFQSEDDDIFKQNKVSITDACK